MQRIFINDGGNWRNARIIYIHDGTAWRKVRDAFSGTNCIYHDKSWQQIPSSGSGVGIMCGSAHDDTICYAIGGTVYTYTGTTLTSLGVPGGASTIYSLCVISSGDILAGTDSAVYKWNGATWSSTSGPTYTRCLSCGDSAGTAYAVTSTGTVQYYNGSTWSAVTGDTPSTTYEVSSNGNTVACVSSSGRLIGLSAGVGTEIIAYTGYPYDPATTIFVSSDDTIYVSGTYGLWYESSGSYVAMDTADCRYITEDDRGDIVYGRGVGYAPVRVNARQTTSNRCPLAIDSGALYPSSSSQCLYRTSTGRMAAKIRVSGVNYAYIWADR